MSIKRNWRWWSLMSKSKTNISSSDAGTVAILSSCGFVAVGIEHISIRPGITRVNALNLYDFVWSHSLAMDVVWGALLGAVHFPVDLLWKSGRTRRSSRDHS
jgi:hypothetical protein